MSLNITAFILNDNKKEWYIGFAGSRFKYFKNFEIGVQLCYELIKKILQEERKKHENIIVVHGGNWRSVDYIVEHIAKELGIETLVIEPRSWSDPNALRERTKKVVQLSDVMYCIFADSITAGTYLAYKIGHELKKEVHAYKIDTEKKEIKKIRLKIREK